MVMKFGGTSVEDASSIRRSVSTGEEGAAAPSGRGSECAGQGDRPVDQCGTGLPPRAGWIRWRRVFISCASATKPWLATWLPGTNTGACAKNWPLSSKHSRLWRNGIAAEKALRPVSQDRLLGAGESLSSRLVEAALRSVGVDAALVDARTCVITDAAHTRATPLWEETNERLKAVLVPLLQVGPGSGHGRICRRHPGRHSHYSGPRRFRFQRLDRRRGTACRAHRDLDRRGWRHDCRSRLCVRMPVACLA